MRESLSSTCTFTFNLCNHFSVSRIFHVSWHAECSSAILELNSNPEFFDCWSNMPLHGHPYEATVVSNKIASRRLQLAGHFYFHPELSNKKSVLREPTHGHLGRGRPKTTYLSGILGHSKQVRLLY